MRVTILLLIIVFALSSCYERKADALYPNTSVCDTTTSTYSGTVLPIMKQYCAISGCHTGSAPANGLAYDKYADLLVVVQNGKLIPAITHTGTDPMPKNMPMLDACTISKIERWVNLGAQNN